MPHPCTYGCHRWGYKILLVPKLQSHHLMFVGLLLVSFVESNWCFWSYKTTIFVHYFISSLPGPPFFLDKVCQIPHLWNSAALLCQYSYFTIFYILFGGTVGTGHRSCEYSKSRSRVCGQRPGEGLVPQKPDTHTQSAVVCCQTYFSATRFYCFIKYGKI